MGWTWQALRGHASGGSGGGVLPASGDPVAMGAFAAYRGDVYTDTGTFTWADRTGGGRDYVQAAAADKPTIVTPAEIAAQSALRFDGLSDYLTTASPSADWSFLFSGTGQSVFAMFVPRALPAAGQVVSSYTTGANTGLQLGCAATNLRVMVFNNAGAFAVDSNPLSVLAVGVPVGVLFRYIEGASPEYSETISGHVIAAGVSAAAPGTNVAASAPNIGRRANGTNYFQCDLAELAFFTRPLTSAEILKLAVYTLSRYGAT